MCFVAVGRTHRGSEAPFMRFMVKMRVVALIEGLFLRRHESCLLLRALPSGHERPSPPSPFRADRIHREPGGTCL